MTQTQTFNNSIIVHNKNIRTIYYSTKFGEDLYIDENPDLEVNIDYDILTHKENKRDFLMYLIYHVTELSNDNPKNEFHISVEGHFEVSMEIEDEMINSELHTTGLSILISYLRMAVYNITSMTISGPYQIPPINAVELHRKYMKRLNKRKTEN